MKLYYITYYWLHWPEIKEIDSESYRVRCAFIPHVSVHETREEAEIELVRQKRLYKSSIQRSIESEKMGLERDQEEVDRIASRADSRWERIKEMENFLETLN